MGVPHQIFSLFKLDTSNFQNRLISRKDKINLRHQNRGSLNRIPQNSNFSIIQAKHMKLSQWVNTKEKENQNR